VTSWIERLRQKKSPYGRNRSDKSAESGGNDLSEKFAGGIEAGAKSDEREASVTFDTIPSTVPEVFAKTTQPLTSEVIVIEYQRFWLDYDLPDGTYTPQELKQSRLLVKRGPVLRYLLWWPGGRPEPITVGGTSDISSPLPTGRGYRQPRCRWRNE
jgi:hypothetical protein